MSKTIKRLVLVCAIGTLMAFTNSANSATSLEDVTVVKNNDLQVINAAIKHPNGKTHFFVGKYFHVYNTTTGKLEKMGLIGKDGWYKLPTNVDAALIHPINKKAYIFKGNQYYRYDFTKKKVDKIGIVGQDGWKGLTGPFDAAITHPTNNKAYFFKGNKYYSYDFKTKKIAVKYIGKNAWKGIPNSINAIVMHKNGRAYAFKDDHYYRYVFGKKMDKKAVIGRDGWKLFHQLDAVVYIKDNVFKPQHYFRGSYGMYLDNGKVHKKRLGYDWYLGVPPNIDAGFLHPKNGKYYFFKGDTYYRYNPSSRKVDKTNNIKNGFTVTRVTAAASIPNANLVYLFETTNYHAYHTLSNKFMSSGLIATKFKGVPNWIDAAVYDKYNAEIKFYKKNVVYVYSLKSMKVIRWGISQSGLFK